jgi:CHASE3 domain sensor protein
LKIKDKNFRKLTKSKKEDTKRLKKQSFCSRWEMDEMDKTQAEERKKEETGVKQGD